MATLIQTRAVEAVEKGKPAVSIVMPVYNLGAHVTFTIQKALQKYSSVFDNFELVVVDDGSSDDTRASLNKIKDERVKVVGYPANGGKGNAQMFGFQFTSGEDVIFADGDMQASPSNCKQYMSALNHADIVVSSKRVPGAQINAGTKRKFLSLAFNLFVKILLPLSVSDTQAGFKAFRREALEKILPLISVKKYAFDVELLVVAKLLKLRIVEQPIAVTLGDNFRKRHMLRMMVDLLGIAYRLRLKRWYQINIAKSVATPYKPILKW